MYFVTGGAGFIGSHLIDVLLARHSEVVCLDDLNDFYSPAIKRSNINAHLKSPAYRFIEGDIRDTDLVGRIFHEFPIKKVIHLAARAGVRPSLRQPLLYEDVNIKGTLNLLELSCRKRIEQFIFASSSSVYGASTKVPFSEDDKIDRTVSPYAATKYAGELLGHTYHHLYGMPISCLRFFTVYGPKQRPDMAIHKFVSLLYAGKPIPVYGDGSTSRDYTYIDDIIKGILGAIGHPYPFEVFNLGESCVTRLSELLEIIQRLARRKAQLQYLPPQPGDVEVTYADISKARRMLDYNPTTPIELGLERFIAWFERLRQET